MTSTSCLRWLRAEMQHSGLKWVTFRRTVFWFSPWELSLVCFIFYLSFFYCSATFLCCSWFFFFPELPPSTPSPESIRHTESASPMRGSASDGDSLFSQDLGEDSVFNNKVGADLHCVSHITQLCLFSKQSCYLFCFYVFLPSEEPLTCASARWSGYVIRLIFSGDLLYAQHLAPLTSCHVTWADQWAKAIIMTSSSDMLPPFFPPPLSFPVDFSTP